MAVPIYIVRGQQADASPVVISSDRAAIEVILVRGAGGGGQPVYVVGPSVPGVTRVRLVSTARVVGGTITSPM